MSDQAQPTPSAEPAKAIYLADYKAPGYTTDDTELHFDICDGKTTVSSTLHVRRQDNDAHSIELMGEELTLLSVAVDGRVLSSNEYEQTARTLTILGLQAQHQIQIVNEICPEANTALEGLYRSSSMYCTQCEAEGFRKITYYQDRPDVLAKFRTTIVADALHIR